MTKQRKVCPCCGSNRVISKYWKNVTTNDGLQAYCKTCQLKYVRAYEAKKKALKLASY